MFDLRNYLTENLAIPLGTPYIKENLERMNFFHFFGPHGSGKSLAVRALQYETDSMIIDLSPSSWEKLDVAYQDKEGIARILYMSFEVARKYQPAIIYIDEIEKIFKAKKKKKKKKKDAGAVDEPPAAPTVSMAKVKKPLMKFKKAKFLKKVDRVAVIT